VTPPLPLRVTLGGAIALALILALTLGALAVVGLRGGEAGELTTPDLRALTFTLKQAFLSAALSVLLAIPLARALARRQFFGRDLLTSLLGAPFLLPVIVAILGVIAVWGRSGWIADAMAVAGLGRLNVYGMPGVLIAHVFFNLPLAARLILQGFSELPPERWRVAAQLGIEGRALFRLVEWPAIRASAPGAFALVFLVCATSFAVALALGGGPRATTLELAIYEAASYDFDLGRAAMLAGVQFAVCAVAALLAFAAQAPVASSPGALTLIQRWDGRSLWSRIGDGAVIGAVCLFLGAPMVAVILRGVAGLDDLGPQVWMAAWRSALVAALAIALTLALSTGLAALIVALQTRGSAKTARLADLAGLLPIAASPFVIGIAFVIVLRPIADPFALALPLTAIVNAAMATPFALRILIPAIRVAHDDHGRLADSLGLTGWTRLRVLYWPRVKQPMGFAAGLSGALAIGDLGVIALFSTPDSPTLPLLMHLLATSRQVDAAHGAALVLIALSFGVFWFFDWLGRRT
jgi:thiamine transport system permease protein